ncbi:FISUMP domain-containing protein [Gaetbulibacter jejuensis]|uniref:FISUMP domain-containing protein n=1 Tax=Gaetbulibacter jejuensis TaxID=584607 RepID=UPI003009B4B4
MAQIGNEGDDPDVVNSVVTVAQLNQILPALTGVDAGNETAYQDYIDANPNSFSSPATAAEVQAMVDAVNSAESLGVSYVVSTTGKIWMDRNLGATQVATSSADAAAYGDLYQWGRFTDGHEIRTSGTTTTNATTAEPNTGGAWDGLFILESSSPYDWLATQDNTLWDGVAGTNNPCPSGYRLPTETELDTERANWGTNNAAGAFASPLKLPVAGNRSYSNGALGTVGSNGHYWSSTVSGTNARFLYFNISNAFMTSHARAYGFSVRCLKE